jgi:hypothetical protein
MNDKLFLRNPEETVLGKKIVKHGLLLINKIGFEEFTFKKLSIEIETTESSVYRYFENKHKFLVYLITWYWSYIECKIVFHLNNITNTELKLKTVIKLLIEEPIQKMVINDLILEKDAYHLIMWEGSKAYLTKHVNKDNKDSLFKPYKDLCQRIAKIIKEYNPTYKYSHSLASTMLETAHSQKFFIQNLPSLTDFKKANNEKSMMLFMESFVFGSLK